MFTCFLEHITKIQKVVMIRNCCCEFCQTVFEQFEYTIVFFLFSCILQNQFECCISFIALDTDITVNSFVCMLCWLFYKNTKNCDNENQLLYFCQFVFEIFEYTIVFILFSGRDQKGSEFSISYITLDMDITMNHSV